MWKKIIGWILFTYGIGSEIYMLATASLLGVIAGLLIAVPCIWGGWKLAHTREKTQG